MKVLLAMLICLSLFIQCKAPRSPEKRAQQLIKDHLFETLHDFKSYESIKFGSLDSSYTTVYNDPYYAANRPVFDSLMNEYKEKLDKVQLYTGLYSYTNTVSRYLKEINTIRSISTPLATKLDSITKNYKPVFNGWSMTHSFRSRSLGGNMSISHDRYYFNKNVDTLLESLDIGKADDHSDN